MTTATETTKKTTVTSKTTTPAKAAVAPKPGPPASRQSVPSNKGPASKPAPTATVASKRPVHRSTRPAPKPAVSAPVAEAPAKVEPTKTPTSQPARRANVTTTLASGAKRIRDAAQRVTARRKEKAVVHNGEIDTLDDIEQALKPAIAEHKRLAELFNEGREISNEDLVHYSLLIETLDAIQRYVDEGDLRVEVAARRYTEEKTMTLRQEVGVSLADIIRQESKIHASLEKRIKKTNERIDHFDGGRFHWGAFFIGLVLAIIAFFIWVSNAHFEQSNTLPHVGTFTFTYTVLNGPFGGIIVGLLVLGICILIGSLLSRPTSSESDTIQHEMTYREVPVPAVENGTASTRVLEPSSTT